MGFQSTTASNLYVGDTMSTINTVPSIAPVSTLTADEVLVTVKEYIAAHNKPCPTDFLIDTHGTRVKKVIEQMKESSMVVGLRGRPPVGGLILPEMVGTIGLTRKVTQQEEKAQRAQERADKALQRAKDLAAKAQERAEKALAKAAAAKAAIESKDNTAADTAAAEQLDEVFDALKTAAEQEDALTDAAFDADETEQTVVPF